ncbi:hypothetical protein B0H14DRAFT_2571092 [Mycena olivaceomarginata]|nr:hypothetical protein B0H14DRAFT_2571092 [Mycena olivaceomarginata]
MTVVYRPWDSHLEGSVEIAARTNLDMGSFGWTGEAIGQPMDDGWVRYEATDIFNTVLSLSMAFNNPESWIPQANYIFARLQIASNYEDYGVSWDNFHPDIPLLTRVHFSACKTGLRPRQRACSGLGLDLGVDQSPSPADRLAKPVCLLSRETGLRVLLATKTLSN